MRLASYINVIVSYLYPQENSQFLQRAGSSKEQSKSVGETTCRYGITEGITGTSVLNLYSFDMIVWFALICYTLIFNIKRYFLIMFRKRVESANCVRMRLSVQLPNLYINGDQKESGEKCVIIFWLLYQVVCMPLFSFGLLNIFRNGLLWEVKKTSYVGSL